MRRRSKQRDSILEYIRTHQGHYTADQICKALNDEEVSTATVYRNLHILEEDGLIASFMAQDGIRIYDKTLTPHHHFICENCHEVYDLNLDSGTDLVSQLQECCPDRIESATLTAYGICKKCTEKER